jgi:hypothetical protein
LTYVLHPPEYDRKHVGGVNAVALGPGPGPGPGGGAGGGGGGGGAGGEALYTAGRDGTVRAWELGGAQPSCALTYEGHTGWVNDLAVLRSSVTGGAGGGAGQGGGEGGGGGGVLLSASSDRTVKLWSLDDGEQRDGEGGGFGGYRQSMATLERHTDYVMALAAPTQPGAARFASAGLGSDQIFLWDINACTTPIATAGGRSGGKSVARAGGGGGSGGGGGGGGGSGAVYPVVTDLVGRCRLTL